METKWDEILSANQLSVWSINPRFRRQSLMSTDDGDRQSFRNIYFLLRTDANNRWSGRHETEVLY
jgi:hypothetical protein